MPIRAIFLLLAFVLAGTLGVLFFSPRAPESAAPPAESVAQHAGESGGGHAHEGKEDAHGEAGGAHGESTTIAPDAAAAAGIKVEPAGPARIAETIRLSGKITFNQNTTAQVKARFPGIVREVKKSTGETVALGDVLALVESNESLQVYPVKSPIKGVVLSRTTNSGELAGDAPLFTVTDTSDVWAEFHVFPRDLDRIKTGQSVRITSFEGGHQGDAEITSLMPVAEASSQTVVARVTLPNPEGLWRAGMTVRGDAVIAARDVAVAVKTAAIQRLEGASVVFVREGERFEARRVRTGMSDGIFSEIVEGLSAGEPYAAENSFQIKANIGKAGAAHEH